MAELVDALASGASSRKGVEVQVLSAAPLENHTDMVIPKGDLLDVFREASWTPLSSRHTIHVNSIRG